MRTVWGAQPGGKQNALRVYIGSLRRKLEPGLSNPGLIVTEWGEGYQSG